MRGNRRVRGQRVSFDFQHAKVPVQSTTTGLITYAPSGLLLASNVSTSGDLLFNKAVKAANFDAELVYRRESPAANGGNCQWRFRYQDSTNFWKVHLTNSLFALDKVVANATTRVSIANYPGVVGVAIDGSRWTRARVRAIGPNIDLYLNGIKVLTATDSTFQTADQFTFSTFDTTSGNARMRVASMSVRRFP